MKNIAEQILKINNSSKNRIDLIKNIIRLSNIKTFCEIGVYEANLSIELLKELSFENFYLIDPWRNLEKWNKPFNHEEKLFKNIYANVIRKLKPYKNQITILRGTTSEVSHNIDSCSLDGVYIDGDHTLRGIVLDLHHIHSKLKKGGFIIGDDLKKNIWQHSIDYSPTLIYPYVVYYAEANNLPIFLLKHSQFLIINDTELGFKIFDYDNYGDLDDKKIFLHKSIQN